MEDYFLEEWGIEGVKEVNTLVSKKLRDVVEGEYSLITREELEDVLEEATHIIDVKQYLEPLYGEECSGVSIFYAMEGETDKVWVESTYTHEGYTKKEYGMLTLYMVYSLY
jgi:hypothetical protein